jgi:hypothetical protein
MIYEREAVPFDIDPSWDCMSLHKAVKRLLSECPSDIQEEVFAYQSIKKGLPDSCRCMESALLDGLVANIVGGTPPSLPAGYLSFVKSLVSQLFPKGWDSDYEGYCRRLAPPLKGVLEGGRSSGGALGLLRNRDQMDHSDFLEVCLFGRPDHRPLGKLKGALQVVQSAGKPRPLTTFSGDGLFLKPLHKTIYNRLSKQKWLMRGDVTMDKLRSAGFRVGLGLLVSGDYASATDNLSIEVMEVALRVMLDNAVNIPPNIREFALGSCRPFLYHSREEWLEDLLLRTGSVVGEPRKGQMMGSYLSFPFLCLQNYLAFRWSTRMVKGRIPVVINGDDILFQADLSAAEDWMETVGSLGLQVEKTKTSVSPDYGSLNSTLFRWNESGRLSVVPTLRFGMLRPCEYPRSLGKSFQDFLAGIRGGERWRAANVFFQAHAGELRGSSWSLPSLGFRGSLAHRLARVFGFLEGRLSGTPPDAPVAHSVCLPPDLVSEVPLEFADSVIVELSSCETASWKWSAGFSPADRVKNAIRYCLDATRWEFDDDPNLFFHASVASDKAFSFRWGGGGRLSRGVRPSRKDMLKPFMIEDSARSTTRVFYRVVAECLERTDDFNCPLPTYEEAVGG